MAVPYYNFVLSTYEEKEARKLQRRQIREICDPFHLPNSEFQKLYRINKEMGQFLVDRLSVDLEPLRADGIPTNIKILSAVQFLANGGYQRQLGQDHALCCAQTTISKFLGQFVRSVYQRLLSEWINFPATAQNRNLVAAGFQEKYGVPHVLGAIDCTHIKIFPPSGPEGAQYKNLRKGDHTINVQLIADSECRIINVNARYPGRVHDSFIWHHSNIREEMKRLHDSRIGNYVLLGDSGYPLEPWLMTPIMNTEPGSAERRYTNWHCRLRNTIERTNGYLKGSLRSIGIDRVLHYDPEKASEIIYACCILYNIMKHFGVELEEDEEVGHDVENLVVDEIQAVQPVTLLRLARNHRQEIINNFFN